MILLEQTNNDSIQSYLKPTNPEIDKSLILKLLLTNVLKRFKSETEGEINKEDFDKDIAPKLTLKVIKLKPEGVNGGIYVANLNQKTCAKESGVSPKALQLFKDAGVEMPSDRILSSRLKEINYSDLDPIRMEGIEYEILYSSTLEGEVEYDDLEEFSRQFDEYVRMYDHRKYTYEDKVKSVYVITLSKHVTNENISKLNDDFLDSITEDIDDRDMRDNVKVYLREFLDNPHRRPQILGEADHILKEMSRSGSSNDKSIKIPTWKIIAAVSAAVLIYLGIKNAKHISNVWKMVSDYSGKDTSSISKAKMYFKALTSKKGRENAIRYSSGRKTSELGLKTLEEMKKTKALAKYRVKSGRIDMDRAKKYLDGLRKNRKS